MSETSNTKEILEEKFSRNKEWSEEFRRGYSNGYSSAASHWTAVLKEKLAAKEKERVNLLRVYPYNLIPIINGENDKNYLATDSNEGHEEQRECYSLEILEDTMANCLTERENKVLQMRYEWRMPLEEVGKEFGVTKERIRQIEAKAIRKLRFQYRKGSILCVSKAELRKAQNEAERYKEKAERLQAELDKVRNIAPEQREEADKKGVLLEEPIDILDLSVRSYHCCLRAGVNTLGDLCGKTYSEMKRVRNMGKTSLKEIENKMHEYGLTFKQEDNHEER